MDDGMISVIKKILISFKMSEVGEDTCKFSVDDMDGLVK